MSDFCRNCQRGGIGRSPAELVLTLRSDPSRVSNYAISLIDILESALTIAWIAECNPPNSGAERDLINAFHSLNKSMDQPND